METFFFDNWMSLLRTLVIGVLGYGGLIAILRISGKRTLSKMNAFDLIVTVALGSTLATMLLSKDVALAEGVLALALLIGLQFAVASLSCRVKWVESLVKSEPALLFHGGEYLRDAMLRERVTDSEIRAAVRSDGFSSMDEVIAVVLETDGKFSVIGGHRADGSNTLQGVRGANPKSVPSEST